MTKLFFGDRERVFALPLPQLEELERVTGSAFGAIFSRIMSRTWGYADLAQTIRLGLIGGGTSPKEAADLIAAYVAPPRPFAETLPVALAILEAAMFGNAAPAAIES